MAATPDAAEYHGEFPPIGDYGFLSDCETTALVAPDGGVEWLCLPRMDSSSVFGAILDRDAGTFRVGPTGVRVPAARRYVPGTMALETSWWTPGGWLVVTDCLLMGPWHDDDHRSGTHRRPPTDYDAEHCLLRIVECVSGQVQVRMDCTPVFDYGLVPATWEYSGETYREAVATAGDDGPQLRLTTDLNVGFEGPTATARTLLKDGQARFVALSWSESVPPPRTFEDAHHRLVWTCHHWQHWLDRGRFPDHPWRSLLQRSALTLKGLTYAPTGAVAAAATTSLPETPRGVRNWDYRYTWMRDTAGTLAALYTLGFDWEANDFFQFVVDVATAADGSIQLMYGVDGERALEERTLDHLSGYDGARPVRVGNAAYSQQQHDVWGAVVGAIALHLSRERLDDRLWRLVRLLVEPALGHWRDPDRGVWEVRSDPQHFTSSKAMCWYAADAGARLADGRGEAELAAKWRAAAEEMRDDVLLHAVDERGVFTQHYDTKALDASVLLLPILGFLPWTDERIRKTVLAIAEELTEGGLVLRYRVDETEDGLAGAEGAFIMCSFWLVSAFVGIGELDRARELCERLLSYATPLQLYAEEIDPHTGRHLGNFPQAFTHLALINAVSVVIKAELKRG